MGGITRLSNLTVMQNCYKVEHVNTTASDYWLTLTGEKSLRAIAKRTGLDQSKVNRQLNGTSDLRVQTVTAICREYDIDMAPVFVHLGFLTEDEARSFGAQLGLDRYSDVDLSRELLRRVTAGTATAAITEPAPAKEVEKTVREQRANVTPFPSVRGTRDDLDQLDEDELQNLRHAAGRDDSAEDIDPETP
jgi:transcriptional regulator with XRE-family HTH domain